MGRTGRQRRVLPQDRLLERHEVRPGVEPEVPHQRGPGLLQRAEGVGLPARPVLREREQAPSSLPGRLLAHEAARLGHDPVVVAGPELGLDEQLLGLEVQLREAVCLQPAVGPLGQLGEGVASPERDRPLHEERGPFRLVPDQQVPRPGQEVLELPVVELVVVQGQPVAVRRGPDRLRAEGLAEPDHAALDDLRRRARHLLAPERLGQRLRPHGGAGASGQRLEDHPVPRSQPGLALVDLERSEHPYAHGPTVFPVCRAVNSPNRPPIPT